MKRFIELKHVGPKAHVRMLIDQLSTHLEEKLHHFPEEAVSLHVIFEENGTHALYRTGVTCHVPGHVVAAHDEKRDAGACIREAFAEIDRQLDKLNAVVRQEYLKRKSAKTRRVGTAG